MTKRKKCINPAIKEKDNYHIHRNATQFQKLCQNMEDKEESNEEIWKEIKTLSIKAQGIIFNARRNGNKKVVTCAGRNPCPLHLSGSSCLAAFYSVVSPSSFMGSLSRPNRLLSRRLSRDSATSQGHQTPDPCLSVCSR